MSTEIAEIKGYVQKHVDSKDNKFPNVKFVYSTLHITRFYGGEDNGSMIQLTPSYGQDYIQLTKEQVNELIQVLTDCFDYDKYPSE